ncbi:membrane protein [Rufibacter radiotolerans]|uniref:Membrane protein n=1 Tax=Rufibacter radiotolerans TaxID=1379910 RepID=A0A0H4VKX3_9BACT|nr:lycopene cyclase domain-containing protein [Rufibacter radiotolerans]AKQ45988.1 membrane protein [Rufibacter radiotolerans]
MNYIYLYLNLFTIFFPLVLSFDRRVHFYTNWRFLFPAMALSALCFITWDILFTQHGVWGFNPDYLVGIYVFNLPLEEVLFFVTVPYACVFIYECLNTYVRREWLQPLAPALTWFLILANLVVAVLFWGRWYTMLTCLLVPGLLLTYWGIFRYQKLGRFYLAYLVHLVPFLLVNGVLTALPVVWYNNAHNVGLRLYTIPAEDSMYSMLMFLLVILLYEVFKLKSRARVNKPVREFV